MGKTRKTQSERGGAKRRRTVLFQDGLGALSVAAFLFLGATVREVNLLMALGAFFAGFAVLDYWLGRRSLRRLRVARRTPDAIFAGEPFDVEIEVDATRRRSSAWGIVVEDEWTRREDDRDSSPSPQKREKIEKTEETEGKKQRRERKKGRTRENAEVGETGQAEARPNVAATTRPTAYFPQVKGGSRRRERYCGVVARRGVRRLATLTASTRFPFGFFRSSERFDAPDEILVFPKIGVLTERWDAEFGGARREATLATARTSRIAGETLTVRDWRPDDSKRAIHWRATAKRDKLQARDFEKRENSVKILILDLFFNENRGAERCFDATPGENNKTGEDGGNKAVETNRETERKERNKRTANRLDAQEQARRLALVEKAVSFAATLVDRWTRSNDARFLLAINGDEATATKENDVREVGRKTNDKKDATKRKTLENDRDVEEASVLNGRVGAGSGAFRRALTRLATVEAPSRDRLDEIAASLDPRVWANARIVVVSVAPLDAVRFEENVEKMERVNKINKAVASGIERGIGGRWRDARTVDVSAFDFDDYFEC